jgi:hypothetical protein
MISTWDTFFRYCAMDIDALPWLSVNERTTTFRQILAEWDNNNYRGRFVVARGGLTPESLDGTEPLGWVDIWNVRTDSYIYISIVDGELGTFSYHGICISVSYILRLRMVRILGYTNTNTLPTIVSFPDRYQDDFRSSDIIIVVHAFGGGGGENMMWLNYMREWLVILSYRYLHHRCVTDSVTEQSVFTYNVCHVRHPSIHPGDTRTTDGRWVFKIASIHAWLHWRATVQPLLCCELLSSWTTILLTTPNNRRSILQKLKTKPSYTRSGASIQKRIVLVHYQSNCNFENLSRIFVSHWLNKQVCSPNCHSSRWWLHSTPYQWFFTYDRCTAFGWWYAILWKSIQLVSSTNFLAWIQDEFITPYKSNKMIYWQLHERDMESEKCSPIVPKVQLVTGALDNMDYWCKVERERVTTSHVHHPHHMHLNDQLHHVFVCDGQELKSVDSSTTIIIPNEDKNYPKCICLCGQKRRGLSRSYACSSSLSRLEDDSWFSNNKKRQPQLIPGEEISPYILLLNRRWRDDEIGWTCRMKISLLCTKYKFVYKPTINTTTVAPLYF